MTAPHNKGTNYCYIVKTLIQSRGIATERLFLSQLTPEELDFHKATIVNN
jgi:hypothetical protein